MPRSELPPRRLHPQAAGQFRYEAQRPGAGWHRHDWRPRRLAIASDAGVGVIEVQRRRWRLWGTTETRLDRALDDVGGIHFALLVVLVRAAGWLLSGDSMHSYTEPRAQLRCLGHRRTAVDMATALVDADEARFAVTLAPGSAWDGEQVRWFSVTGSAEVSDHGSTKLPALLLASPRPTRSSGRTFNPATRS